MQLQEQHILLNIFQHSLHTLRICPYVHTLIIPLFFVLPPSTKNMTHLPFLVVHKIQSIFIYGKFSTNNNSTHHSTNTTSHLLFLLLSYFTNSKLKPVSYTNCPIFCGWMKYLGVACCSCLWTDIHSLGTAYGLRLCIYRVSNITCYFCSEHYTRY